MTTWQQMARLLHDRSGNFGMMTAILLPVLLGVGGVALDLTNMMMSKTQLQEASDSAALAAATALATGEAADEAAAEALAKQFFLGQMGNYMGEDAASALAASTNVDVTTKTKSNGKSYEVGFSSNYRLPLTPLMGMLGYQTMNIAAASTATSGTTETKTAFTMALILDESGSMAWEAARETVCVRYFFSYCVQYETTITSKMQALKRAAEALFDALDEADPDKNLVRTAVYSYDHEMVGSSPPNWGTEDARGYVSEIREPPAGGTDATQPMTAAISAIKRNAAATDAESNEHRKKQNNNASRYIVLMTDGEMTGNSGEWKSSIDNKVRAQCELAKSGDYPIRVFTVAFKAPDKGKELLRDCATSPADYFEAETMEALITSFSTIAQDAAKSDTLLTN
ncbi:MAG: VWA domain-containing protein [Alphaproteobacteria bacterium]|uniref:vWA domain-containing protein n=1 Tax=Pseudorhizobium pelagicum TaxID=1509405 RepID=UPI001D88A89A|nr:VWA domain-containing protein [Alphaproteobacteria bacterium]MBU1548346.1 VWA domain-containing protein [Alphaproteobacteria bacterium]MBU2335892.1 VWA domain-containing protein [Alphaproteobacteria bacterium]MBU2390713.1 VWA domain-containing protein [Alphaproteobacteria bacterium]